jgi:uncharacterized protein DUF397
MTAEVRWRKSSRSSGTEPNCIEVADLPGGRLVRDSKRRGAGPILGFDEATWAAFLAGVKRGEFGRC